MAHAVSLCQKGSLKQKGASTLLYVPSKHATFARSNPEAFWLWPATAITASTGPDRMFIFMPDLTSRIHFYSIFPKEAWIMIPIAQN